MKIRNLLLASAFAFAMHAEPAQAQATTGDELRVMLVGNSLTYTNNLPALLRAVGAAHGVRIVTETYAEPGGTLADRWDDGHVARALSERKFDAVVLQEQGGKLAACMASLQEQRTAPCAASAAAYSDIAKLAGQQGGKTLLFATWGPDDRWQARLNRAGRLLAEKASLQVFDAAGSLSALRKAQPGTKLFPDGTHPSTQASLMLALALYRDIVERMPEARELRVGAPLLPVNAAVSADQPLEAQAGLAGDGKAIVVPASLIAPLVQALPPPGSKPEQPRSRRRR